MRTMSLSAVAIFLMMAALTFTGLDKPQPVLPTGTGAATNISNSSEPALITLSVQIKNRDARMWNQTRLT